MSDTAARIFTTNDCNGCNQCISACTVVEANYARMENGKNKIYVDGEKCINCGKCLEVCPHNARDYHDDAETFLNRLSSGRISVVAAPAIRSNFSEYEKLLGTLRKLGVRKLYDTSFGADITTWGYIRYIQQNNATGMISQPCPAVVNYIEKHKHSLIKSLVPIHSPAACTAIYMRKYRGIEDEIAFLSPCIAKKDEFTDSNTDGLFQYNVTFRKLAQALEARGIDYLKGTPDHFDNDEHGMGSIYPMPGGLKENVHRVIPEAWVYQVEGQPEVKHFLDEYGDISAKDRPFLVDILNCVKGCNIGTGALNGAKDDLAVSGVMHRNKEQARLAVKGKMGKKKLPGKSLEEFDKTLKLEDFVRRYQNKVVSKTPVTAEKLEQAFTSMYKLTEEARRVDCRSCGYATCKDMAMEVAKQRNHVENCVEYHKNVLNKQQSEIQEMLSQQEQSSLELQKNVQAIFESMSANSQKTDTTVDQVSQIHEELTVLQNIADKLNELVDMLGEQIGKYVNLSSDIISISTQTKLLSMNASVEAAHAHELGKGFAVVAGEMKNLSEQSATSAKEIISSNDMVLPMLNEVREFSENLNSRTKSISEATDQILEAIRQIQEAEQEVTSTASRIIR